MRDIFDEVSDEIRKNGHGHPPKVATAAQVAAYAKQKGISVDAAKREFIQFGYKLK